ncbi:translational activator GCN1, partial [Coprinopsis sp. MPI-PUGE-AT-0042]
LSLSQILDIFRLLTLTYPKYVDNLSRDAVEEVGMELVRRDELREEGKMGVTEQILGWLSNEVGGLVKRGTANSHAPWSCGLYTTCMKCNPDFPASNSFRVLVGSMAFLLDMLSESNMVKPSMRRGAVVRVRRALRSAGDKVPKVIEALLALSKSNPSPTRLVTLIGVCVGVLIHLKNVPEPPDQRLPQDLQTGILSLYTSTVIVSKNTIPPHIPSSIDDFVSTFVTPDDFEKTILPVFERSLLRSPELSLPPVTQFFQSYAKTIKPDLFKKMVTQAVNSAKHPKLLVPTTGSHCTPCWASSPPLPTCRHPWRRTKAAISVLAASLPPHITYILQSSNPLPNEAVQLIAKEMGNAKPAVRRAFANLVGSISSFLKAFAKGVAPACGIERCKRPGGPLEGYVALAVLLGPLAKSGAFDDLISKNTVIQAIVTSSAKQPFLLWDKVYQKVTDPADEIWLLRAADAAFRHFQTPIAKSETLRAQFGLVFVHLAVEGKSPEIRKLVNETVANLMILNPRLTGTVVREALISFVSQGPPKSDAPGEDGSSQTWNKHSRLSALLLSAATFEDSVSAEEKGSSVAESVVLRTIPCCGPSRQTWIDVCMKAGVDPLECTNDHLSGCWKSSGFRPPLIARFSRGSYAAAATLAFISPAKVLPETIKQIEADLDATSVKSFTELELGVWATPPGQTYVDVLSSKNEQRATKGKEAAIAKSQAKAQPATLTKQQEAAVKKQLDVEAGIRQQVAKVKADFERGLNLGEKSGCVRLSEVGAYVGNSRSPKGAFLVGDLAFETYLDLSSVTSDRLDTYRRWIGIATLRCYKVDNISEELQWNPLDVRIALVVRVLYRLRFLSEQAPWMLREDEEKLEQSALSLSIIKFHAGEFDNVDLPRLQTLETLIHAVRTELRLRKEASSTLIELGEAVQVNARKDEIAALIRATLCQESHARNAYLSTLQPFDLTELDWSPELWIAYHDEDDEQNANLAQRLWEENGHDNAYVRSSTAAALATAVEQAPSSASQAIKTLEEYYRDKAKILAPEFDQYGMVVASSLERADPWTARLATAAAFEQLAPSFPESEIEAFFHFLIQSEALGDRAPEVRRGMLNAGTTHLETQLGKPSTTETEDFIKEGVVILFGRVARHLDASDSRIPDVVDRLGVQIAVAECISPLVKLMKTRLPSLVDQLFQDLFQGEKYAIRRGAAYGIAGVIKGTGITGMREFDVLRRLQTAAEDKKQFQSRQGVMFLLETLSTTLGRLFEPYITHVLPLPSDKRPEDASRIIQWVTSPPMVSKLILPTHFDILSQWRSKKGSIELPGMNGILFTPPALSFPSCCHPPSTGVLTGLHAQVRTAANKSLEAVIPIIDRGLRERGADTKKKAVQIVGNLASLTDTKDFRLGEGYFPDLVPGLLRTLKTDTSGVDRQGAAQGLSEVLSGLGMDRLEGLLPDILANARSPRATVREGFMSLLEYVREAAMKAGRMVVTNYSTKAIDLFAPGARERNQSSITLVGELLFKIVSDVEEEQKSQTRALPGETSRRALLDVLGAERRDHVLALLYLVRQDGVVIWKALVHNTPRTGRRLPLIVVFYRWPYHFRTMSEFGERILGEIIPLLKTKSHSTDSKTRQGVCSTISEILERTNEDEIISIVRVALVDDEANVRAAAAPSGSGTALQALQEVMSHQTVFPVLIPTLTAIPMTVFNARALASLVTVAGNALSSPAEDLAEAVDEAIRAIMSSVSDAEGLINIDDAAHRLVRGPRKTHPRRRTTACQLFGVFCDASDLDSSLYRTDWIRQLISLFDDETRDVHTAAWSAMDTFVKSIPKDELEPLVVPLRRTIESTGAPGRTVPGFNLPKGAAPTVPIIIAGLTTGSNEQREQAAYAIGDLVERTEEAAIKPFVVPFTGPLIRVATQATNYPPGVKIGILSALIQCLKVYLPSSSPSSPSYNAHSSKVPVMRQAPTFETRLPKAWWTPSLQNSSPVPLVRVFCLLLHMSFGSAKANVGEKARESCIEVVSEAFRGVHNGQPSSAHLYHLTWSWVPHPTSISSYAILAIVDAQANPDSDHFTNHEPNLFQLLGLMKPVAQKILESAANEKPIIARPAREARDRIKDLDDDSLRGLF